MAARDRPWLAGAAVYRGPVRADGPVAHRARLVLPGRRDARPGGRRRGGAARAPGQFTRKRSRLMSQAQAASGEPEMRASDAERDRAAEILRTGYAEGRLSRAELDERLAAATRADLRDLTCDLPAAAAEPAAAGRPAAAELPFAGPGPGTGGGPDRCLLLCLLLACPPAGIVYWILTARRQPREPVPQRPPLPGAAPAP